MNKKFTKLMAALALLVFMMPSMVGWGQTKITNYNNIVSGKSYYIGATVSNTDYYLSVAHQYVASSAAGSGVTDISNASTFVFEGSNTSWTIKFSDVEDRCLGTLPTSNGKLNVAKIENIATFTTSNQSGKIRLSNNNRSIQKNSSTSLNFGSYGNTQTDIWLMEVPSSGFSVTYKANGGTGDNFIDDNGGDGYESGATVTIKGVGGANEPAFSKIGYHFANWTDTENALLATLTLNANDSYTIAANTTLFAQWAKNTHVVALSSVDNVTLTANYGSNTITEGNSASAVEYGTEITLNAADLASGYTFIWQITKTTGGEDVTASLLNGTTLTVPDYAITIGGTVVPVYSVTYDCNGGTNGCPSTEPMTGLVAGTNITLADAPTKAGSVFMGWNDGTTTYEAGGTYTVNSTVTLTAQWTVGGTGTIAFNSTSSGTAINAASVTGVDNLGNTWTVTTVGTTSFTPNSAYYQVGSGNKPATSITFTMTLPEEVLITAFSAKFGGFSATAGTVTLKVGETTVGSGSLNTSSDVVISNNSSALGTILTVTVTNITAAVKCYYISYAYTTSSDPIIIAPNAIDLSSTDTNNEFTFDIMNPVSGKTLSASTPTSWISNVVVDNTNNKVTFTTTENETTTDRSGSITLSYDGADNKSVIINQSKIDYAPMPLAYNNGKNDLPIGFTQSGLSSDYSDANSKLKFDGDGDYLILKLKEAPVSLSYTIKGNTFSAGVFEVQSSADGETFDNLIQYTYSNLNNDAQTVTHIDIASTVRYIRWIFTDKMSGNVGIGNIHVTTEYDIYGTATTASLEPTSSKKCTIHDGGILTVNGTLTNNDPANLIIEDGAQLVTSNPATATLKKMVKSYNNDEGESGWKFIASPLTQAVPATNIINMIDAIPANYGLFYYDEPNHYWYNYKQNEQETNSHPNFNIQPEKGYLYAKNSDVTIEFVGEMRGAEDPYIISDLSHQSTGANSNGFNLVGNPFTYTVYANQPFYIPSDDMLATIDQYWSEGIAPGSGIMVQATEDNNSVTFTRTAPEALSKGSLQMNLAQNVSNRSGASSTKLDNVIISFNEGSQLGKFYFGESAANIYIQQANEEYAVVNTEAQGEMPVNFRANEDGQYTLTVNPENVDMNYLHLIDNMTGMDVDLLQTPSYTFDATTRDYESRFRLVFAANNEDGVSTGSTAFAFYSNGNWIINNAGEATLQVIDLTGRILSSETVNGSVSKTINATPGVYMLRLINGENVNVQKIVVR